MAARHKRLGIDTDVWALINRRGDVRGGDYKPHIYWTKKMAKEASAKFPECDVVKVRVFRRRRGVGRCLGIRHVVAGVE
jgi:hypothetical protein